MPSVSEQIEANRKAGRTDNGYANYETENTVLVATNDYSLFRYFVDYPKAVPCAAKIKRHVLAYVRNNPDCFIGCDLRRIHWNEVRANLVEARREEEQFRAIEEN